MVYNNRSVTRAYDEDHHHGSGDTHGTGKRPLFGGLSSIFASATDVQNIDLMNLAGFCRNCCSKWYRAAAEERGIDMSYEEAREIVYGMPYSEWKDKYQGEASAEQLAAYEANKPKD